MGIKYKSKEFGTGGSQKISDYVNHDDAGRRELDAEAVLEAEQQGHRHCEHRQQDLVLKAGITAEQGDSHMQQCKYMYDPS